VAFYLLVQAAGYVLGNLVSTIRRTPRQSPAVWRQYFHELNQPAFAPPSGAFLPVWAINNVSAIWGLLQALNKPAGTPGRAVFLRLQALSWLDLVVWNTAYFVVRSPVNGFVLTALFLMLTLASIGVAVLRLKDSRVALSLATLCVWLLLATPVALLQMHWNRDDLWQVGPRAIPDPRRVWSGLALREAGAERTGSAATAVTFRALERRDLDWYLASGEWRGRAGGYAIQERGGALVRAIEGDYLNVVGLPVGLLLDLAPCLLSR